MGISQSDLIDLNSLTVADFLSSVFETHEPLKTITGTKKSIFHEIGLHRYAKDSMFCCIDVCLEL